jgi:hypothetical protein
MQPNKTTNSYPNVYDPSTLAQNRLGVDSNPEFESRLSKLCKEFSFNGQSNASYHEDPQFGFSPVKTKRSRKTTIKGNKAVKALNTHSAKVKNFQLHGNKNGVAPSFNFEAHSGQLADALVTHDSSSVLNRAFGYDLGPQSYIPQSLVVEAERPLDYRRLIVAAYTDSVLAVQKGIFPRVTVTVSSGEVGIHYLAAVTLFYDMIRACNNERSMFEKGSPFYNYARSFITPRKVGTYNYNWSGVPDIEALLAAGIPFELEESGPNHTSLAWFTGTQDIYGRDELVNTIPVLTVDDLMIKGVESVTRIWIETFNRTEKGINLVEIGDHSTATKSAAAFVVSRDLGPASYNGYLTITCEVPVPEHEWFMSALSLVDRSAYTEEYPRGPFVRQIYIGSALYNWRTLNQDLSRKVFTVRPRQIPMTSFMIQMVGMLIQADVLNFDLDTGGVITQPETSIIKKLSAGDFIMALFSFILKRYSIPNFLMLGTESINKFTHKIGVGTQFTVDYGSVINGVLPTHVTECLASLGLKVIKTGGNKYDLVIPYIVMTGTKTNADPFNNTDLANPLSVVEAFNQIYPNATFLAGYEFNNVNPLVNLDITQNHVSFFSGDRVNLAINNFNVAIDAMQGNFDIGVTLANVHTEPYTLADYTLVCTPFNVTDPWDDAILSTATELTSVIPFDPNRISDQLTRILPVVFGDNVDTYIAMTGESASLRLAIPVGLQLISSATAGVHLVAGIGFETSIRDRVITGRGEGGGMTDFLKSAGRMAIPAISQLLGGVANSYLPGSGGIITGLGDGVVNMLGAARAPHHKLVEEMIRRGHTNPYARALRPITQKTGINDTAYHITRTQKYY